MVNFWQQLKKPIFCLAPMEEVTDFAFREMFGRYSGGHEAGDMKHEASHAVSSSMLHVSSKNDFVMFTEFINVDGLTHPEGFKKLSIDLKYSEIQRPMVAQLWGTNPEKFYQAAQIVAGMGFDGIDINMGCPQDKEIGIGACAALIRQPELAKQIIEAVIKGGGGLPVSVKTRLGYTKTDEMENWIKNLLETNIAALTLHARTKQEKSKVPAHWDKVAEAVKIRDELLVTSHGKVLIIGNGDIKSREEGLARIQETGCDGVMIARGAFGNPWLFNADIKSLSDVAQAPGLQTGQAEGLRYIGPSERLRVMLEHAELFHKTFAGKKSFFIMRKHFKAYCSGFSGSHELRAKLMEAKDLEETKNIVEGYLKDIG